ncbi:hypothetical protein DPMN_159177 [Dreissena polymorpha]|uniref:Uncharacterized protein n=1 Tax=Dreissena polymorpha TaxID=45954 RepID=A0A9D4ENR5_DREPO|nr:hypothetical protein DPMN_159177 [Dreissena polymorpha]
MTDIGSNVRTFFCDNGSYNDMATLFFNSQEEAIKQLFHQPGIRLNTCAQSTVPC